MATHPKHAKDRTAQPSTLVPSTVTKVPEPSPEEKHEEVANALTNLASTAQPDTVQEGSPQAQTEAPAKPRKKWTRRNFPAAPIVPADTKKLEETKAAFYGLGEMVLKIACVRMPNPIPPSKEELEMFGGALSRVVEKYYPQLDGYDPEIVLLVSAVIVFAPRLKAEAKLPQPPLKVLTQTEIDEAFQAAKESRGPSSAT